jgi:hypothetical protein
VRDFCKSPKRSKEIKMERTEMEGGEAMLDSIMYQTKCTGYLKTAQGKEVGSA